MKSNIKTIPILKGFPGFLQTSSNHVSPTNKMQAKYTDLGLFELIENKFRGLNFAYTSPKNKPRTGTPIHKKTHSKRGVTDVCADSLLTIPGVTSKNKIKNPNNFPVRLPLVLKDSSLVTIIDSFQEIFKYTNVINTTRAEEFKTISTGIGKSPTFTTP